MASIPPISNGRSKASLALRKLENQDRVHGAVPGFVGLTYTRMGMYLPNMARAATTADAFNAVAEPRRRQILDVLAGGERPVNDLVDRLGLSQPQVSKHLRVLREVGLVRAREEGRQRIYRLNGRPLKPIHDWLRRYEETWSERFDRLDEVLEELKEEEGDGGDDA